MENAKSGNISRIYCLDPLLNTSIRAIVLLGILFIQATSQRSTKNISGNITSPWWKGILSRLSISPLFNKKGDRVVTTQSYEKNAYTGYHINLLRNLATYTAIALDNASAYRQLNATLSELKTTQNQLVQQEKLASLGQLTAGIEHEIRNPLNSVNNFSEVSVDLIKEAREETLSKKKKVGGEKSPCERGNAGEAGEEDDTIPENNYNPEIIHSILDDIEANLCKIQEHGSRADSILKSMLQHSRPGPAS